MTITQIPIIEFTIGRNADSNVTTESFPTTADLRADTNVVSRITMLDRNGNPDTSLVLTREALVQLRDVLTMAIDAAPQVNRIEIRRQRLAAIVASLPPCRYCEGTGFKSFVDEVGKHHRTAERNGGKCDICHGHGRTCNS